MTIGLGPRQVMAHKQQIIMTPKLQQAIEVLLMPRLELEQFLTQQLEENPLLDEVLDEHIEVDELAKVDDLDPGQNEPEEILDREDKEPDIDWENCFDDMISSSTTTTFEHWDDTDQPQSDVAEFQSLRDYLLAQLNIAPFNALEREIGEQIIGNVNDDGQLKIPMFQIHLKFQNDLDNGTFSKELHNGIEKKLCEELQLSQALKKDETLLSENTTITVKDEGKEWLISDEENRQTYTVRKEDEQLNVYSITMNDIANAVGCDVKTVEEILLFIQRNFEPTGIPYRTIPETLLIQMEVSEIDDPIAKAILKDHFKDWTNNQIPRIAQNLNVDNDRVMAALELIKTLDPYPGRHFSDPISRQIGNGNGAARYIIPEVAVKKIDGKYHFIANDDGMPRLRLNPHYIEMMLNGNRAVDNNAKQWLEKQKSNAIDLIRSIIQRRQTIEKVTEAIFEIQEDFLEQGVKGVKPLTLRQIAEMVDVHESTVSRVTTNKYVETPQGIYPLKFFFSSELSNISATIIKEKIKEMIDKENSAKPLSDQAIADALEVQGIDIKRRTVQKYRDELGILSSGKRKRKW